VGIISSNGHLFFNSVLLLLWEEQWQREVADGAKVKVWGVGLGKILIILDMGKAQLEAESIVKKKSHKQITWEKSYGITRFYFLKPPKELPAVGDI